LSLVKVYYNIAHNLYVNTRGKIYIMKEGRCKRIR